MLELQSVTKRLGTFAIENISLKVEPGEYFIILGPSGAGKTVILEAIAGLLPPDQGKILWKGRDVTFLAPEKRHFTVMYQDYSLFQHMNVEQNIGYGPTAQGVPAKERKKRIEEVAEQVGVTELLKRRIGTLSGGEQQRVALARALITRPEMILLDEPLAALDGRSRVQLRKLLHDVQRESGATWVHVTHDLEEAMTLGDRIGIILNNRLAQIDTPAKLFRSPSHYDVASFLGMQNVFPAKWIADGVCDVEGVKIHASEATPATNYFWIKPEEVILSLQAFASSARNQFACRVEGWEPHGSLLAIHLACNGLTITALITFASFENLDIRGGSNIYVTFKSSAIHCF